MAGPTIPPTDLGLDPSKKVVQLVSAKKTDTGPEAPEKTYPEQCKAVLEKALKNEDFETLIIIGVRADGDQVLSLAGNISPMKSVFYLERAKAGLIQSGLTD